MKSSNFLSPKHPSKICDIAIETVIDSYIREDIGFYSDIFSFIQDGTLYLYGSVETTSPLVDADLIPKIEQNTDSNLNIVNNIIVNQVEDELVERTFTGIYLGFACTEVNEMIPFEHQEAKGLVKEIYSVYEIPLNVQVHVNGNRVAVSLEHNHTDIDGINQIITEFFKGNSDGNRTNYNEPEIHHSPLRTDVVYKSTNSIVSTFYGPRAWYGETEFIGTDTLSNKRLGHLICREVAKDRVMENNLLYCAVEITYNGGEETPVHFGIKGNSTGIHLENGTFFEHGEIEDEYQDYKKRVVTKLRNGEIDLIEIAKWGYQDINIST